MQFLRINNRGFQLLFLKESSIFNYFSLLCLVGELKSHFIIFIAVYSDWRATLTELFIESQHWINRTASQFAHFKWYVIIGQAHSPYVLVVHFVDLYSEIYVSAQFVPFVSIGLVCYCFFDMFQLLAGRTGGKEVCGMGINQWVVPLGLLSDGVSSIELLLSNQIPQCSCFRFLFIFEDR